MYMCVYIKQLVARLTNHLELAVSESAHVANF